MAERKPLFQTTEGFSEEMAVSDSITLGGLTMGGVIDMGSSKITNLADGVNPGDSVNKGQLDSLAFGFDRKQSCRLKTVASLSTWIPSGSGVGKTLTSPNNNLSNNDFDSITAVLNDRILVTFGGATDLSPNSNNGIYEVTQLADGVSNPTILTRTIDADEDAEVTAGMFTFVAEGTVAADTGWYVTTNDPITVDTTGIAWSQFAGVGTYTGGDGIDVTAGVISVDFTADKGLHIVGGKLEIELDETPDTLDADAAGLKVVGLPSLFKINDVAVGATVDAASLDTLTDGSNADGEHYHTETQRIENTETTATDTIAVGDPVYANGADTVGKADASVDAKVRTIGVTRYINSGGGSPGSSIEVVGYGPCAGVLTGATPNTPYYIASGGGLTSTPPTGGDRVVVVGYAINSTDLYVQIRDYGKRA